MRTTSDLLGRVKSKPFLLGVLAVLAVGLFAAAAPAIAGDTATQDDTSVEQNNKSVDISLEHANGTGLVPGEPQRYNITIQNATEGVGAYKMNLEIEDDNIASFTDYELLNDTASVRNVTIPFNKSSITETTLNLSVALANQTFDGVEEGEDIVVAQVLIKTDVSAFPGTEEVEPVEISTTDVRIDDSSQTAQTYQNGDVGVGADVYWLDPDGNGEPARDTTGDGLVDDINGNGDTNVGDVIALFNALDGFNDEFKPFVNFVGDDTQVNVGDVIGLFNRL